MEGGGGMRRGLSIGPIEFNAKLAQTTNKVDKEHVIIPRSCLRTQSWSNLYPECVDGFISNSKEISEIFPMLIQLYNLFYGHSK